MPMIRDLVLRLLPARWRDDAIAQSKRWHTSCESCGAGSNIWDMGGLRFKATGRARLMLRCRGCGRMSWHGLSKR